MHGPVNGSISMLLSPVPAGNVEACPFQSPHQDFPCNGLAVSEAPFQRCRDDRLLSSWSLLLYARCSVSGYQSKGLSEAEKEITRIHFHCPTRHLAKTKRLTHDPRTYSTHNRNRTSQHPTQSPSTRRAFPKCTRHQTPNVPRTLNPH